MWEIGKSVPGRVKRITYNIDTCHSLAWCSELIGQSKDWLDQYQDNVTEWNIHWVMVIKQPDFLSGAAL